MTAHPRTARRRLRAGPILVLLAVAVLLACPKRATVGYRAPLLRLQIIDSLLLPENVAGMCLDRDGLLFAEYTGSTIYRADWKLKLQPPLAPAAPVAGLRGLAADAFYIYLYDDNRLWRMDRSSAKVSLISSSLHCQSAAVMSSGQVAVVDGYSDRVLLLEPAGGVSDLDVMGESWQPAAVAVGVDNNVYILDQTKRQVVALNRVGSAVHRYRLPGPGQKLAVDDSLNVYVLDPAGTSIARVDPRGGSATTGDLWTPLVARDLLVAGENFYLLGPGRHVYRYRIRLLQP
jgi:hypothetical protein